MKHYVYTVFLEDKDDTLDKEFLKRMAELEVDGHTVRLFRAVQLERKESSIITNDSKIIKP